VKRGHVALISASAVGVIVALLVVVLATRDPATEKVRDSPIVGKPAPALRASTIDDTAFDLETYGGEFVLVNFFATWCVPCRQEHADLVELDEGGATNVVSVVYQDSPQTVQAFLAERGGDWPVLEDPSGQITLDYGVSRIPESYLIAPGGTVVAKFVRGVRSDQVTDVIDRFS
jgi:cytochrome c biogenesis protein CcmG, thiol:disulfide interchange protein DsbE